MPSTPGPAPALSRACADTRDANKLWGLVFLVFLVAVPALIVGAVAFSKLPSDCAGIIAPTLP
jgi:hypothetical protein